MEEISYPSLLWMKCGPVRMSVCFLKLPAFDLLLLTTPNRLIPWL